MRKLAQEERTEANRIANEGGKQIIADLRDLAPCELMLLYSKEEFFDDTIKSSPFHGGKHRCIDGDTPILKLCSRSS